MHEILTRERGSGYILGDQLCQSDGDSWFLLPHRIWDGGSYVSLEFVAFKIGMKTKARYGYAIRLNACSFF